MIIDSSPPNIENAARAIQRGDVVAFPTETVYGLGADARSDSAVQKIYDLKGRPPTNPLIVHLAKAGDLPSAVMMPQASHIRRRVELLSTLWPGPLTLILPKASSISPLATAGLSTVGVRIPAHSVARDFIEKANAPIAAPSANPFSRVSPTTAQHVYESFGESVPYILDGGPCSVGLESTIVDVLGARVRILRPGGVTRETLAQLLGEGDLETYEPISVTGFRSAVLAPGMLVHHYSPVTPLAFREEVPINKLPPKVGLLCFKELSDNDLGAHFSNVWVLSKDGDLEEVASNLFSTLRQMDKLGLDLILVDSCSEDGIGYAIMDRLRRAKSFEI